MQVSKQRGRGRSLFSSQAARSLGTTNHKDRASSQSEVFRVVISKESSDMLDSALSRCVEGFAFGAITKSDVANYIFKNLNRFFLDSDVKALRTTHFDEKKVLGSILRTDTELPEELRKAIRTHFGLEDKERKRPPKKAEAT